MRNVLALILIVICAVESYADSLEELVEAMAWVESRNDPNQHNIKENAVGYLQIRPIMIDEVNRLLKKEGSSTRYTHEHAWNKECSIEIFENWVRLNNYKDPEVIARNWNGGYRGIYKKSTEKYWKKVKTAFLEEKPLDRRINFLSLYFKTEIGGSSVF